MAEDSSTFGRCCARLSEAARASWHCLGYVVRQWFDFNMRMLPIAFCTIERKEAHVEGGLATLLSDLAESARLRSVEVVRL